MKFLLSLDYELFFGYKTGSVQKCLVQPVTELLKCCKDYGLRLSLFVDAGFLIRLREEGRRNRQLLSEYSLIRRHLDSLLDLGHDIQLHIHPHWQDCYFDNDGWHIQTRRYKLHDFDASEQRDIVRLYKDELTDIAGDRIFAFRGGGWCIQPFGEIANSLMAENIWLESTVFYKGRSEDARRGFDFTSAPDLEYYRFSRDPSQIDTKGFFFEVPITSIEVGPLFFWRMIVAKKFGGERYRSYGDGAAMIADKSYYLSRLTRKTRSVVSIDGLKAFFLGKALQIQEAKNRDLLHVMGHPKALTPYSIACLSSFLAKSDLSPITYQDFQTMAPCCKKSPC